MTPSHPYRIGEIYQVLMGWFSGHERSALLVFPTSDLLLKILRNETWVACTGQASLRAMVNLKLFLSDKHKAQIRLAEKGECVLLLEVLRSGLTHAHGEDFHIVRVLLGEQPGWIAIPYVWATYLSKPSLTGPNHL